MAKSSISIGDDTPTGEPENAPRGPYITDKDDGTRDARGQKPFAKGRNRRRRADDKLASAPSLARPRATRHAVDAGA